MRLKAAGVSGVFGLLALVVGLGQATTYGAGPPATPLVEAAKQADAAAVRALLQTGADVNAREVDGTTGLHWAAYHDDPELVDVLVRAGAKAGASNRYGVTPLWLATINGNAAIVERLLDAGADARAARADNGETTLMIAARAGHVEVMKVLLDHGANVNAVESHRGQTALMWAAAEKHPAAVELLLEAGADTKARSARTELTPLMFAIRAGDIETTRLLLDVGDLTETASDGTSLLMLAVLNANFELANFLLERGADPNVDDPHGSPLFVLTWLRSAVNRSLTSILVRTPSGNMDSFDLGRALLTHGADIDARIEGKDPEPVEDEEETAQSRRRRRWRPDHLAIGPYYLSFAGCHTLLYRGHQLRRAVYEVLGGQRCRSDHSDSAEHHPPSGRLRNRVLRGRTPGRPDGVPRSGQVGLRIGKRPAGCGGVRRLSRRQPQLGRCDGPARRRDPGGQ